MRLCILVFKSLLTPGAHEISFVKSFHYKLVYSSRSRWLATGWTGLVPLPTDIQTRAAVKIVARGALSGVSSYHKANGT